jgi:alpha-tubulin suppressor-like RCC1 family protein
MALLDLGKIKITNKGLWSNVTNYEVDDFVQSGKHTFICIANNLNEEPYNVSTSTLNSSFWSFMAQGAEAGDWNAAENTPEYITNKPKIIPSMEVVKFSDHGNGHRNYRSGFVLMSDGHIRCWGSNDTYQLGDGQQAGVRYRPSNVAIPKKVTRFCTQYQGGIAITEDNECWVWGNNAHGQHGFNHTTVTIFPRAVPLPSGMTKFISAQGPSGSSPGSGSTYIYLCENAQGQRFVYTCGYNGHGQIGDGTTTQRKILTQVSVLNDLNVEEVYSEGTLYGVLGVKCVNGDIYMWGYNDFGLIGNGSQTNQTTPLRCQSTSLPDLPVKKLSFQASQSSHQYSFALLENGQLWFAGGNYYGIDGSGSSLGGDHRRTNWVHVSGEGSSNVVDFVHSGYGRYASLMVLKSDEKVYTIGYNGYGQLGIGDTTSRNSWQTPPVSRTYHYGDVPCNVNVKKIFAARMDEEQVSFHFIRDDGEWDSHGHGKAFAMGQNATGGLGTGHNSASTSSGSLAWDARFPDECLLPPRAVEMFVGGTNAEKMSMALLSDGTLWTCGYGQSHGRETDNEQIETFGRLTL